MVTSLNSWNVVKIQAFRSVNIPRLPCITPTQEINPLLSKHKWNTEGCAVNLMYHRVPYTHISYIVWGVCCCIAEPFFFCNISVLMLVNVKFKRKKKKQTTAKSFFLRSKINFQTKENAYFSDLYGSAAFPANGRKERLKCVLGELNQGNFPCS